MKSRYALGVLSVFLLLTVWSGRAMAWDPAAFLAQQHEAHKLFVAGNHAEALEAYRGLHDVLMGALDSGAIPEAHLTPARQALSTIDYQVARCLQLMTRCAEATVAYREVLDAEAVLPDVRYKLPLRLAETQMCEADQSMAADDYDLAQTQLDGALSELEGIVEADAQTVLPKADAQSFADELAALRSGVQSRRESIVAGREAAHRRQLEHRADNSAALLTSGRCDEARSELDELAALQDEALNERLAAVELSYDEQCTTSLFGDLPIGPIALAGAGVLLLVSELILEGVLMGTASDFEDARETCLAGGGRCAETMDLADSLDTGRVVSAVLLTGGIALIAGGALWYFLDSDDEADQTQLSMWTTREGAGLMLSVPF